MVQAEHYHAPAPVHVSVATGHGNVVHHPSLTGSFESGPYDPSRIYHMQHQQQQQQQQQQHHQHQQQMSQNFNQQSYPGGGRTYPPTSGYIHQQHGKAAEAQTGGYFAAGQQQHIRSHPQQTAVIGPEATQQQQHLYRPASPMISAMAPQHGSPPLSYTGVVGKPLVPCGDTSSTSLSTSPQLSSQQQQLGGNLYGAGHPSFQAQHHRQVATGQQQQHLLSHQQYLIQQQQQQHSIVQSDPSSYNINTEGYQHPAAEMAGYQQQPNHSPVMYNNNRCASNGMSNGNYNNNGQQVCHGPMASSSSSSEPVIADLDQLQQQQRQQQQQQQHCSVNGKTHPAVLANATDGGQPNQLHLHSNIQQQQAVESEQQTPQSQQSSQQRHALLPGLVMTAGPVPVAVQPQQTVVMNADDMHGDMHGDIHGDLHGDMMDHHLTVDLNQHSPLDGSGQLPPLMDGESPPGSLHDSPLYPWMRSQFGNLTSFISRLPFSYINIFPPQSDRHQRIVSQRLCCGRDRRFF